MPVRVLSTTCTALEKTINLFFVANAAHWGMDALHLALSCLQSKPFFVPHVFTELLFLTLNDRWKCLEQLGHNLGGILDATPVFKGFLKDKDTFR